jgi:hypothetical protein
VRDAETSPDIIPKQFAALLFAKWQSTIKRKQELAKLK